MVQVSEKVVTAKVETIRRMLNGISTLPLAVEEEFVANFTMVAAGESMLRRALEALLDLGRHISAKGFSKPVVEYKQIGSTLGECGVLNAARVGLLVKMAGYRNRLTHFYDEVTPGELYEILNTRIGDIESVLEEILKWLRSNPESLDTSL